MKQVKKIAGDVYCYFIYAVVVFCVIFGVNFIASSCFRLQGVCILLIGFGLAFYQYYKMFIKPINDAKRNLSVALLAQGFCRVGEKSELKLAKDTLAKSTLYGSFPFVEEAYVLERHGMVMYFGQYIMGKDLSRGFFFAGLGRQKLRPMKLLTKGRQDYNYLSENWEFSGLDIYELETLPNTVQNELRKLSSVNIELKGNELYADFLGFSPTLNQEWPPLDVTVQSIVEFSGLSCRYFAANDGPRQAPTQFNSLSDGAVPDHQCGAAASQALSPRKELIHLIERRVTGKISMGEFAARLVCFVNCDDLGARAIAITASRCAAYFDEAMSVDVLDWNAIERCIVFLDTDFPLVEILHPCRVTMLIASSLLLVLFGTGLVMTLLLSSWAYFVGAWAVSVAIGCFLPILQRRVGTENFLPFDSEKTWRRFEPRLKKYTFLQLRKTVDCSPNRWVQRVVVVAALPFFVVFLALMIPVFWKDRKVLVAVCE